MTTAAPTRRDLLVLLAATACAGRRAAVPQVLPDPDQPVRLGWRWLPGQRHAFRTEIERTRDDVTWTRVETWTYEATDLTPDGAIHLKATRTGIGATVREAGEPVAAHRVAGAREALRTEAAAQHTLALSLSGRLLRCDAHGFADALPHRLLALHFPTDLVSAGETWDDPALVRAFAPALPLTATLTSQSTSRLTDVLPRPQGWAATMEHVARLEVGPVGGAVEVVGTSTFDTDPGALARREVFARWRGPQGGSRSPGTLHCRTRRLDTV